MRDRHQSQHIDASHIMQLCAQYSDHLRHHAANEEIPDHWETPEGHILWLKQASPSGKDTENSSISVRLTTPSELLNNPDIRQGVIALAHQVDHYKQQLTARTTQSLDEKEVFWAPSISNKVQTEDLEFGQTVERFLHQFKKNHTPLKNLKDKLTQCLKTLCLAVAETQVTVTESNFVFPTPAIQNFKERFNRMMERRIRLLNRALECHNQTVISYIPLGLESDCTPKRVSHKLSLLNEIEKQSLSILMNHDIHTFADAIADTPHHITDLIQPLLNTVMLWHTLWPEKEAEVHIHVMVHLQALRLHPKLSDNQPRLEGILRKIEGLLRITKEQPL